MTDEQFFAWLDGELPDEEVAKVARIVAADPLLMAKAQAHRAMQASLAAAFAPIANQPVTYEGAPVFDLADRRQKKQGPFPARQWAALAATLIVGILTGTFIASGDSGAPFAKREGTFVASADLGEALNAQLASAPSATGWRIGLTFRDHDGAICRSFTDGASEGLACREGDVWHVRALVQGMAQPTGDYRMATGQDPALAAKIDSVIEGEPFDAQQEKAAKDAGWK